VRAVPYDPAAVDVTKLRSLDRPQRRDDECAHEDTKKTVQAATGWLENGRSVTRDAPTDALMRPDARRDLTRGDAAPSGARRQWHEEFSPGRVGTLKQPARSRPPDGRAWEDHDLASRRCS
jgi:hypothetical protein